MKRLFLLIFIEFTAFAGVLNGGGGKGVVCRDSQNVVTSVELLDLWEARTLKGQTPLTTFSDVGLEQGLHLVFEKLKKGSVDITAGPTCPYQNCIYDHLAMEAEIFLRPNTNLLKLRNVTLELTEDSYEVARPTDCKIEQIVNYQNNDKILLNLDLYEKMDLLNQIALIAHESYYSYLRKYRNHKDSIRTRRAIGYVFSGNDFKIYYPNIANVPYSCYTHRDNFDWTLLNFYWDANLKNLSVHPRFFDGTIPMGLFTETFALENIYMNSSELYNALVSGKCESGDAFKFKLDGPIEYDREFGVTLFCKDKKPSLRLTYKKINSNNYTSYPMTCEGWDE